MHEYELAWEYTLTLGSVDSAFSLVSWEPQL